MEHILKASIKLSNGRRLEYKLRSWRLMFIDTNCTDINPILDENTSKIISIDFDGIYQINVGTTIPINYDDRVYNFQINTIVIENNAIYLAETERNITDRFIIPVLKLSIDLIGNHYLLGSYLYTEKDISGEYLYLWYRYIDEDEYKSLETRLMENPNFINKYDITQETTLFKFKIPKIFLEGVKLISEGKYSKISNEFKRIILQFYGIGKDSEIGYILYRHPNAVKALEEEFKVKLDDNIDVFRKMNKQDETFRIAIIPD